MKLQKYMKVKFFKETETMFLVTKKCSISMITLYLYSFLKTLHLIFHNNNKTCVLSYRIMFLEWTEKNILVTSFN